MTTQCLTTCEAEVMNVVWEKRLVTVQEVVDSIPRTLAYTTVMTTVKILEDKGFVEKKSKRGRAFVYGPLVSYESASRSTFKDVANRFFDGSVKSMMLSMIKTKQITSTDLAELRAAIDSLEKKK